MNKTDKTFKMISVHSASPRGKAFKTNLHKKAHFDTRGRCSTLSTSSRLLKILFITFCFVCFKHCRKQVHFSKTVGKIQSDKTAAATTNLHEFVINCNSDVSK